VHLIAQDLVNGILAGGILAVVALGFSLVWGIMNIINLAHGAFDWILIDTPPVLAVTDAVILAPSVTGVIYVIGAEMTRRRLAERALETILSANPRSVAVVLNKVDFSRNKYYYSRYYGHQYKNYYASAS